MWLVFSLLGGLRWTDVGWRASALVPALIVVGLFWLGSQGSLWFAYEAYGGEPTWGWRWRGQGGSVLAGLHAQLLGNSLVEETLFRGFLLPQVYLRFAPSRSMVALIVALLATLVLSVLIHVPNYVYEGQLVGVELREALFFVFRFQLALALVFLVTRNLFICVGLHAVWNARPTLIDASWQHLDWSWWFWTGLLLVGWGACSPRLRRRMTAQVSGPRAV